MMLLSRLIEQAARRPGLILLAAALLSLLALLQLFSLPQMTPRLKLDPSTESLLPLGDRDRQVYERVRSTFGEVETVLMSVRLSPMFTPQNMARIEELTRELLGFPGVKHVFSLGTAANILADGQDVELGSFTRQAAQDPAAVKDFVARIHANPLYRGVLLSEDGEHTALVIGLDAHGEERFRRDDYTGQFRELARRITGSDQVWLAGSPVVKAASTGAMLRTLFLSLPVTYLIAIALVLLAFRSVRATFAVVLTVSLALLWTLATAVAMGLSLNLVSILMPPLVVTLGLAYAIHLLSDFYDSPARSQAERRERRLEVMNRVGAGLLLAGITTIAGFLALMPGGLLAVREFALLSSIGVGYLFLLILFFLPALLDHLHCAPLRRQWGQAFTDRWADRLAAFDIKWRRPIVWTAMILVVLDLWLAAGIQVGTNYIRAFREGVPVREEYEALNRTFDGANLVSVLIETHVNDALTDPELVQGIDALQQWLREQPEVGQAVSYVDHLKLINQSLNENDPAYFSVPQDSAAIKQLLLFAGGEEIRRVLDARLRSALISVRIRVGDSVEITDFVERVEARLAELKPPLNGSITGTPVLATRTVNAIGRGQGVSLAIACFVIWAMLALMFTSARAGLWALLPNLVPVSIYFGTLSLLDIPLSPTNSLIAAIVLGVAVDDTVHYLTRFNRDARATGSELSAVGSALRSTLRPSTLTTLALCLGLLALTGSELRSQVQFGLLASFTLFLAWVSGLTLTPALGSRLRIVTLWDLLRMDLGPSPQHTIPLLSGLSLRQARIFALTAKLESHASGDLMIRQGDFARDMFVVVDGTLEVSIDRNGERKVLATMRRGAVLGEAGYFGQRRTADVSCITAVRVLRFDAVDLERLRRRNPWIAATIFRNLNRVQAERLARATAMLG